MKTTILCFAAFAGMLFTTSAEIPDSLMLALQKKAPEKLEVKVVKVSEKQHVRGQTITVNFEVVAEVAAVESSLTELKAGDRILIKYRIYRGKIPPGSYPASLKEGESYKAYLGPKKGDGRVDVVQNLPVYSPAAARGSFELSAAQNAEAKP